MTPRPDRTEAVRLFEITLVLFVAGNTLQLLYPWLPPLNRLLGALLGFIALYWWSQRRGPIPAEIALFGAFVAWGVLTGFLFARNQHLALAYGRLIAQELVLLFALAEYATARRTPTFAFLLLLVLPLCLWWYALGTGELTIVQAVGEQGRLLSLSDNPNAVGFYCLYGLFGLAYFLWNRKKQGLVLWPLLALPIIGFVLVLSGSRKSILSVGIFALMWAVLAYGRTKVSKQRPILLLLVTAAALFLAGRLIMERTPAGGRFRRSATTPHFDASRYTLYQEGWTMFLQAPVLGVGLGNFVTYSSTNQFAHSDSMEVLATTGIVGFVLYFSIYLVLWLRLRRILRKRKDATSRYVAGLYQAILITTLALGLGTPNFLSLEFVYIVGLMIGHMRVIEQDLRSTRPAESGTAKDVTSSLPVSVRRASRPSI